MTPNEFKPNGIARIAVKAEIYGNWAITESVDETEDLAFCITDMSTGRRIPEPFVYEDISDARELATLLHGALPQFEDTPEQREQARQVCLAFLRRNPNSKQEEIL